MSVHSKLLNNSVGVDNVYYPTENFKLFNPRQQIKNNDFLNESEYIHIADTIVAWFQNN